MPSLSVLVSNLAHEVCAREEKWEQDERRRVLALRRAHERVRRWKATTPEELQAKADALALIVEACPEAGEP